MCCLVSSRSIEFQFHTSVEMCEGIVDLGSEHLSKHDGDRGQQRAKLLIQTPLALNFLNYSGNRNISSNTETCALDQLGNTW